MEVMQQEMSMTHFLLRNKAMDIKRLMEIGSYRGIRHRKGLPVGVKELKLMLELEKVQEKQLLIRK